MDLATLGGRASPASNLLGDGIENPLSVNFGPLRSLGWQLHVYGEPSPEVRSAADQFDLPVFEFPWSDAAHQAGANRGAAYLVRPDGYVALALEKSDQVDELTDLVRRWGLRFGGPKQLRN